MPRTCPATHLPCPSTNQSTKKRTKRVSRAKETHRGTKQETVTGGRAEGHNNQRGRANQQTKQVAAQRVATPKLEAADTTHGLAGLRPIDFRRIETLANKHSIELLAGQDQKTGSGHWTCANAHLVWGHRLEEAGRALSFLVAAQSSLPCQGPVAARALARAGAEGVALRRDLRRWLRLGQSILSILSSLEEQVVVAGGGRCGNGGLF